ncbi:hypothetical protein V8F20_002498 [Naviculisporaceae sp. PSN 640]
MLKTLDRILSRRFKIQRMLRLSFRDQELMSSYKAFRESALLLRDLTSDLRMSRQLLGVSGEIAQLLLDQDEPSSGDDMDETYSVDKHDGESAGKGKVLKSKPGTAAHDHDGATSVTTGVLSSKRRKTRRRLERFNRDIGELLASDFTRDLIVLFETDSEEPSKRFKPVLLRNKIDTFSDENFISHKIIDRYAEYITTSDSGGTGKITTIPEAQRKERELTVLGGEKFIPEREIKLEWYRPKDAKKRETTFIIADKPDDPPFDTIICKADWDTEAPKSAFPIFGKHKPKKTKKEEKEAEKEEEKAALELIRKQLEEASKLTDMKGKGKGSGDGPASGSAAAVP